MAWGFLSEKQKKERKGERRRKRMRKKKGNKRRRTTEQGDSEGRLLTCVESGCGDGEVLD